MGGRFWQLGQFPVSVYQELDLLVLWYVRIPTNQSYPSSCGGSDSLSGADVEPAQGLTQFYDHHCPVDTALSGPRQQVPYYG
jgi:hypothetical protein